MKNRIIRAGDREVTRDSNPNQLLLALLNSSTLNSQQYRCLRNWLLRQAKALRADEYIECNSNGLIASIGKWPSGRPYVFDGVSYFVGASPQPVTQEMLDALPFTVTARLSAPSNRSKHLRLLDSNCN